MQTTPTAREPVDFGDIAMTSSEPDLEPAPPQRIDLGDMALVKSADGLTIEHIRLAEPQPIELHLLVNWLRRQLREVI